jgi:dihydroxyacetone kinase-like protein
MDVGMGVHGEAGIRRARLSPADQVVDELIDLLLADGAGGDRGEVAILVNTLGATPLMEGYIALRRVEQRLAGQGVKLHRSLVGEYITSLEMTGLSITLLDLDEELRRLLDASADAVVAPPLGRAR